uniref:Uncharacterized protein n=1 Tax=Pipistrellus kuhlii TaxID=59472 RepID=A0A7J7RG60_PIPKU|nr:hypothetical protein mPipKuh1_010555 [Pipistrellus kuhlii]
MPEAGMGDARGRGGVWGGDRATGMPLPCPGGPPPSPGSQVLRRLREQSSGWEGAWGAGTGSDSLRDHSASALRWPIRGVGIWEVQFNSRPLNIRVLTCAWPAGRCWCCAHSRTELGGQASTEDGANSFHQCGPGSQLE